MKEFQDLLNALSQAEKFLQQLGSEKKRFKSARLIYLFGIISKEAEGNDNNDDGDGDQMELETTAG